MGISRGFSAISVAKMIGNGMARVVIILRMFIMLGMLTAIWRACGTIPFLVYYGVSFIDARYFILFAFLLSCIVSLLIGSSIGTAATIGIVLMIIARSGGADTNLMAGAIISGIYFGDRSAPTSSSANLVAVLTKTDLLDNVKNMLRSAFTPIIISTVIYLALSVYWGMDKTESYFLSEIPTCYNIGIITLTPALMIIILSLLKFRVIISMFISILTGVLIAVLVQGVGLYELITYMLTGYELKSSVQFAGIISGGGITSMLSTMCIVLISSGYSGIFEGTEALKDVVKFFTLLSRKVALYPVTLMAALFTSAFGCTQTLSIILTHQIMCGIYIEKGMNNSSLALDIEDSCALVAALFPWNIAVAVPMIILSAGVSCIPYAVFLYILPIYRLFFSFPANRRLS
jgi:NhaC family Na+:H+ antiporter